MGERSGVLFVKGELLGVSLMRSQAGLIILALEGVSDISWTRKVGEHER